MVMAGYSFRLMLANLVWVVIVYASPGHFHRTPFYLVGLIVMVSLLWALAIRVDLEVRDEYVYVTNLLKRYVIDVSIISEVRWAYLPNGKDLVRSTLVLSNGKNIPVDASIRNGSEAY